MHLKIGPLAVATLFVSGCTTLEKSRTKLLVIDTIKIVNLSTANLDQFRLGCRKKMS